MVLVFSISNFFTNKNSHLKEIECGLAAVIQLYSEVDYLKRG